MTTWVLKTRNMGSRHTERQQCMEPDRNPLKLSQCNLLSEKIDFRIHRESSPLVMVEELVRVGEPRMFTCLKSQLCIPALETHCHIRLNHIKFPMFNHFGLLKWQFCGVWHYQRIPGDLGSQPRMATKVLYKKDLDVLFWWRREMCKELKMKLQLLSKYTNFT